MSVERVIVRAAWPTADDARVPIKRMPTRDDVDRTVEVRGAIDVVDEATGETVAYLRPEDPGGLAPWLHIARTMIDRRMWVIGERTAGMKTKARTFGAMPRDTLRLDYCRQALIAAEHPDVAAALFERGEYISAVMRSLMPERHAAQVALIEREVKPEWRAAMPGTPFTSGIVNMCNPLTYHRDAGNFAGTWNAMAVVQRRMRGGHLVLARYRTAFSFEGYPVTFTFMPAEAESHGVTPMMPAVEGGYRLSMVFYASAALTRCGSCEEELSRIRLKRSEREQRRHSSRQAELEAAVRYRPKKGEP